MLFDIDLVHIFLSNCKFQFKMSIHALVIHIVVLYQALQNKTKTHQQRPDGACGVPAEAQLDRMEVFPKDLSPELSSELKIRKAIAGDRHSSASTNTKQFCLMQDLNTLHQFLKNEVLYSSEDLVIQHHYKWNILKMYQLVHPLYYSHFFHVQSQLKSPASPGYSTNQKRPLWLTLYYHREPNYIIHQLFLL